jgi:hypothetical protein
MRRRALAAARRADEYDELAVGDVEAQVRDGLLAIVVSLRDLDESHTRAIATPPRASARAPALR